MLHSHDYPPGAVPAALLRRVPLAARGARPRRGRPPGVHAADDPRPRRPRQALAASARASSGRALVRPLAVSARHHAIRQLGAIVGTRADRVPRPAAARALARGPRLVHALRRCRRARCWRGPRSRTPSRSSSRADWTWDFVARAYPRARRWRLEPHSGDADGPVAAGVGGAAVADRLGRAHDDLPADPPARAARAPRARSTCSTRTATSRTRAAGLRERDPRALRARRRGRGVRRASTTSTRPTWRSPPSGATAFPVRDLPRCREKAYLVQDHEPEFFATSAQSIWAEETYRMGYRCIAYTPWMADMLRDRYGLEARWFECGTDLDVFPFAGEEGRREDLIAVYARRETERRAVDLAMAGLAVLAERRPSIRPVLFGSRQKATLPFAGRGPRRRARPRRLAAALPRRERRARLLAHHPLAGGPRDDGQRAAGRSSSRATTSAPRSARRATWWSSPRAAPTRSPTPSSACSTTARAPRRWRGRARAFVEERTWERAGDQVESALRDFLATPR